jgi:hypothetical protein
MVRLADGAGRHNGVRGFSKFGDGRKVAISPLLICG